MLTRRAFHCRVCNVVRFHGIIEDFQLGDDVVCGQCLGCGVLSVHRLDKEIKGAVKPRYIDGSDYGRTV